MILYNFFKRAVYPFTACIDLDLIMNLGAIQPKSELESSQDIQGDLTEPDAVRFERQSPGVGIDLGVVTTHKIIQKISERRQV